MEPPVMEDFEDLDEVEEPEGEAAANRRQFTLLMAGLGAILVLAVIAFLYVMLSRDGEKSDIELTNEAVLATNRSIELAIEATGTADVIQGTAQAVAMVATQEAQQKATVAAATAAAQTAEAQPTATNTSTPTPVVASPTATTAPERPSRAGDAWSWHRSGWHTNADHHAGAATTPDTGIGGLV
jgi:cell division septation protein DedD